MSYILQGLIVVAVLFLLAALPRLVWSWSGFFFALNQAQWYLHNPFRNYFRDNRSKWPRRIYLLMAPFLLCWGIIVYVALIPARILSSLYFDMLLFWSVNLRDQIADIWDPRAKGYRYLKGWPYWKLWLAGFPYRLGRALVRSAGILFQGFAMFLFDLVWPSLTLFHGTSFQGASVPITQSGKWKVGYEDFVGTGIYFAIAPKVAAHYAGNNQPSILVARVTMTLSRPVSTLVEAARKKAGFGGGGDLISSKAGLLTGALEHWRADRGGWWEYCLVFPGKKGKFVQTWRIRPVCVLPVDKKAGTMGFPQRIWKGISLWPYTRLDWGVWSVTLTCFLLLLGGY